MATMALILMEYGNKQEEMCQPMQIKTSNRLLSNGEISEVIPPEKKLHIVSQNESHISIVTPYSSSITHESGNIFRIEGLYELNCKKTRVFGYIDKFTVWRVDKYCGKHPNWPDYLVELKKYLKCDLYKNWCRASITCTPKEFVNMDRCFWEERLSGVSVYKNDQLLTHHSVTLLKYIRPIQCRTSHHVLH
jgi:hypothetical protein